MLGLRGNGHVTGEAAGGEIHGINLQHTAVQQSGTSPRLCSVATNEILDRDVTCQSSLWGSAVGMPATVHSGALGEGRPKGLQTAAVAQLQKGKASEVHLVTSS